MSAELEASMRRHPAGKRPTYCAECDSQMVACPWGGMDCPQCDKGHHDGPDWDEPFSNVRELRDRTGEPMRPWLSHDGSEAILGTEHLDRTLAAVYADSGRGYMPDLRRQVARAFDVPFYVVDDQAAADEARLRAAEPDRWADDGGSFHDPLDLPPLVITITPNLSRFLEAMTEAGQRLLDAFRTLAAAAVESMRNFTGSFVADPDHPERWRRCADVPPRRWRDWLPAAEPKVDRARREHVDRAMRTRARRADRRRRIRARKAAPFYALARSLEHSADALDVLRNAAAGAR